MHDARPICILWDASHIWGLMAWRAVRALGLACRLVKGKEIAEGALLGKPGLDATPHRSGVRRRTEQPCLSGCPSSPLLLAPGGNARLKAQALGDAGATPCARIWPEAGVIWVFAAARALLSASATHGKVCISAPGRVRPIPSACTT